MSYNLNEYYPESEIRNFPFLEQKLEDYYDFFIKDDENISEITPRGFHDYRVAFKEIYYYISWLYDNNPKSVIDVGAGNDLFKKWFPNIVSMDIHKTLNYDYNNWLDHDFCVSHSEQFDCGMALNSLHFGTLEQIIKNINNAMSIIKENGRFLFTLNITHVTKDSYSPNALRLKDDDIQVILQSLVVKIKKLPYKLILMDIPTFTKAKRTLSHINGDIRFILEKGK